MGRRLAPTVPYVPGAPIAAASIGQVHRAELPDGRVLAIKVQYPGVASSMARLIIGSRALGPPKDFPRRLAVEAAIDLLPGWARALHGLAISPLERPIVRAGT